MTIAAMEKGATGVLTRSVDAHHSMSVQRFFSIACALCGFVSLAIPRSFAESGGGEVSIAIDGNGTVHAVHLDDCGTTHRVKYSYLSGSSWTTTTLDTSTDAFLNTWVGLGSSDNVIASWVRGWNYGSVMLACKNGGWSSCAVKSGVSPNAVGFDHSAMSVYGTAIHFLYERRNGTSDVLEHALTDCGCTSPVFTSAEATGYDGTAAMMADASGDIHAVYLRGGSFYYRRRPLGGDWEGPQLIHAAVGKWYHGRPGIAMDSAGNLHVTYTGSNLDNHPRYANTVGGSWVVKGAIDSAADCDGGFCRIARAPDDSLHVVYWDLDGSRLMYALSRDNGTTWSRMQKGNQDDAGGCDIAVNQGGQVYLVYEYDCELSCQSFCGMTPIAPASVAAVPNPVELGGQTTLSAAGDAVGTVVWYANGCGTGVSVGSGPSIQVGPTTNTTYYARMEGPCGNSDCASVAVEVVSSGACCLNWACIPDQTEGDCDILGGLWMGCLTDCSAEACSVRAISDFDQDGTVDRDDYDVFEACATGPAVAYDVGQLPPSCGVLKYGNGLMAPDLDLDGDVDQSDFAVFQRCLSSEDLPADPNCSP
ncbi:MAG: hypothetical protein QUV05_07455 [Phycisphaerae bacterium]|nr:hypothetical protein [Phycisphaerae bacterium]